MREWTYTLRERAECSTHVAGAGGNGQKFSWSRQDEENSPVQGSTITCKTHVCFYHSGDARVTGISMDREENPWIGGVQTINMNNWWVK